MDTSLAQKFADLYFQRKKHLSAAEEIQKELDILEQELLDAYAMEGIPFLGAMVNDVAYAVTLGVLYYCGTVKDGKNATPEERQRACNALKKAGLSAFVYETYNQRTLSAYVKDVKEADGELPAEFEGAIKISFENKIKVIKAGEKKKGKRLETGKAKADPGVLTGLYEE